MAKSTEEQIKQNEPKQIQERIKNSIQQSLRVNSIFYLTKKSVPQG